MKRLRIAWFSPLYGTTEDAENTVSAYVTDELAPFLRENFEIEFYHDTDQQGFYGSTFPYRQALKRHEQNPFDIFVYQVEDCRAADFTREHLLQVPGKVWGIVWFHDVLFLRGQGEEPFLLRECEKASAVLFSSERNLDEYRRQVVSNNKSAFYLPYPVSGRQADNRCRNQAEFTICFPGTVRIEHRAHQVLQAVAELSCRHRFVWLASSEEQSEAEMLLREFGINGAECIRPRTPAMWRKVVSRADIAIHTLFSAYRDPGPFLAISLMAGVPSVVNDFAAAAWLSDKVVFKIQSGEDEVEELRGVLSSCYEHRDEALQRGELGAAYAREFHSSEMVAAELSQVFTCAQQKYSEHHWSFADGPLYTRDEPRRLQETPRILSEAPEKRG